MGCLRIGASFMTIRMAVTYNKTELEMSRKSEKTD
jgi:hypothetical protein